MLSHMTEALTGNI